VAVKIKLKRVGKIHAPQYRIVVADSRTARNGRAIEEIGIYQPVQNPSLIQVKSERAQYWLGVGAQPTEAVLAILKVTGDWQKFKGLPGAEGTLQVAAPKPSKVLAYEAAVTEAQSEPKKPKPKKLVTDTEKAADVVAHDAEKIVEKAVDVVEDVAKSIADVVEDVAEKVADVVEDVAEKIEQAAKAVEHKVEDVLHKDDSEKTS
jgi:small subunit ribosomal protein S16